MVKALVYKELREIAVISAVAACLYLLVLGSLMESQLVQSFDFVRVLSSSRSRAPFVSGNDSFNTMCLSFLFAVTLGFRQSLWELRQATMPFLLHRPVSRTKIFALKSLAGIVVLLVIAGLPILIYAWWCAIPGNVAMPFFWSMTEPAWRTWLLLPVVYFASLLSGFWHGRWFGTRLLPLLPAALLYVFVLEALVPRWVYGLLLAAATGLYVLAYLHVASTREYS